MTTHMLNDFRFAIRSIGRTPVFTAIVVLTLGVAIAGATAVASVARAMVFHPLLILSRMSWWWWGGGPMPSICR